MLMYERRCNVTLLLIARLRLRLLMCLVRVLINLMRGLLLIIIRLNLLKCIIRRWAVLDEMVN